MRRTGAGLAVGFPTMALSTDNAADDCGGGLAAAAGGGAGGRRYEVRNRSFGWIPLAANRGSRPLSARISYDRLYPEHRARGCGKAFKRATWQLSISSIP